MIKLTPAIRLSLGLVFLTISILIVAQGLGLTPSKADGIIMSRQHLAESIALQTTLALKRRDELLIQAFFDQSVKHHAGIQSIALRKPDMTLQYATADHDKLWGEDPPKNSTPTHFQIPILVDGVRAVSLEVYYAPIAEESKYWFGIPHFFWLISFVCISGFVVFLFYIKRMLQHLDPSSVVPTRVRNALNVLAEGVLILDKRDKIVLLNEALAEKLGTTESSLVGRNANEIDWIRKNNDELLPWQLAQQNDHKIVGARLSARTGKNTLTFNVNAVPIRDGNGRNIGVISSFDDVTELEEKTQLLESLVSDLTQKKRDIEEKNKELNYLASRDPLTNCYNRRSLVSHLDNHFKSNVGDKKNAEQIELCLIMTDIDYFRQINDAHGHNTGDDVIRGMAQTLMFNLRPGDVVARFGGEEFCILLPNTTPDRAYAIADMCRKKIESRKIAGLKVTASFGVSSIRFGAKSSNDLIHQADEALYQSKSKGRNCTTLWSAPTQAAQL